MGGNASIVLGPGRDNSSYTAEGIQLGLHCAWLSEIAANAGRVALGVDASDIGYEVLSTAACFPKPGVATQTAWLPMKAYRAELDL